MGAVISGVYLPDFGASLQDDVFLAEDIKIGAPANCPKAGEIVTLYFTQDGVGNRNITSWHFAFGNMSWFAPIQTAGQTSFVSLRSNGDGTFAGIKSSTGGGGASAPSSSDAVTLGGTLHPVFSTALQYDTILNANLAIAAPLAAPAAGTLVSFSFRQDSTGGRTTTSWNAAFLNASRFQPRQGPNQASAVVFRSNGDNTYALNAIDGIDCTKEMDIRDFGAQEAYLESGNNTDVAINAALQFAENMQGQGRSVRIPDGYWYLTNPVVINHANISLKGQGKYTTILSQAPNWGGPMVLVVPPVSGNWQKPTLGAALATGAGGSWPLDGTNHYVVQYSDTHMISLSGLTAFCMEFFFKPTATTHGSILSCRGGFNSPGTYFFGGVPTLEFDVNGDDGSGKAQMLGRVNINGSQVTAVGSTGVTLNAVHHVALDYDGAHLRIWLDGVLGQSTAATGNVVSHPFELFALGPQIGQNDGVSLNMAFGHIDGIRVSKASRYTSSFTPPTAKPSVDSTTLFTHNFDNETPYLTGITCQEFAPALSTKSVLLAWNNLASPGPANEQVEIADLTFTTAPTTAGGIYGYGTSVGSIRDIVLQGGAKIHMENNCFEWVIHDVFAIAGGLAGGQLNAYPPKFAVYLQGVSGAGSVSDVRTTGYVFPIFVSGSSTKLRDFLITPTSQTIYCGVLCAYGGISGMVLDQISIDDEALTPSLLGGFYVDSIANLTLLGGGMDITAAGGTLPMLTVHTCNVVNAIGTGFGLPSTSSVAINSTDKQAALNFIGCFMIGAAGQWSDDAANTFVVDSASQSVGIHKVNHAASPVSATGGGTWLCDATAGTITFDLPAANTRPGLEFIVKKTDSSGNAATVTRAGSDTIDGATTFALGAQYKFVWLVSDGVSAWNVVGSN